MRRDEYGRKHLVCSIKDCPERFAAAPRDLADYGVYQNAKEAGWLVNDSATLILCPGHRSPYVKEVIYLADPQDGTPIARDGYVEYMVGYYAERFPNHIYFFAPIDWNKS